MSYLPFELLTKIFNSIRKDKSTLISLSLVCRDWRKASLQYLFLDVTLEHSDTQFGTPEKAYEYFTKFPHLTQYVKGVTIRCSIKRDDLPLWDRTATISQDRHLPLALNLFPSVAELSLSSDVSETSCRALGWSWLQISTDLRTSLANIISSPSLLKLGVKSCWDIPLPLLGSSPNVYKIQIFNSDFQPFYANSSTQFASIDSTPARPKDLEIKLAWDEIAQLQKFLEAPGCNLDLGKLRSLILGSGDKETVRFLQFLSASASDSLRHLEISWLHLSSSPGPPVPLNAFPYLRSLIWVVSSDKIAGCTKLEGLVAAARTVSFTKITTITLEARQDFFEAGYLLQPSNDHLWKELDNTLSSSSWPRLRLFLVRNYLKCGLDGNIYSDALADTERMLRDRFPKLEELGVVRHVRMEEST